MIIIKEIFVLYPKLGESLKNDSTVLIDTLYIHKYIDYLIYHTYNINRFTTTIVTKMFLLELTITY